MLHHNDEVEVNLEENREKKDEIPLIINIESFSSGNKM